jgi:hypothetical protein
LQVLYFVGVELCPVRGSHVRFNADGPVEHNIVRSQSRETLNGSLYSRLTRTSNSNRALFW